MSNSKRIEIFIAKARSYIISYFNKNNKHSIDFRNLYQFENLSNIKNTEIVDIPDSNLEDFLGSLYENNLDLKDKKDLGTFYTRNEYVIDRMLESINLNNCRILEPSCGSGAFVIAIIKRLIELKKTDKPKDIIDYICNYVYANDIDEIAIAITEINILGVLMPYIISAVNEDKNYKMKRFNLSNKDFLKKRVFEIKFDIIIGNPPFVTMYGKRSRNMTEEKRIYFNTFDFVQNKTGNNKFNLSMFFVENGLKLLNKDGRLIYIMDISFYETAFIDLRRYIVKNYNVVRIIRDLQEFNNVASGQIIIDICNHKDEYNIINNESFLNDKVTRIEQYKYDDEQNKYKFFIPFNEVENEINEKVKKYNRLDYYFPNKSLRTCCALTGKTDDFIVDKTEKTNSEVFPYIEGSKGLKEKFGSLQNTKYIKYDYDLQIKISNEFKKELGALGVKNKKRVTLGDKVAYMSPKIFIRQSAFEIISTYTEKNYAANNSIYVLTLKSDNDNDKKLLKYVCGILNSELITFYCRINRIIRCDKGQTPQIKTSDLKDIRICIADN